MTISKRFLSPIFVSQVIVTILVISSLSVSAMDWDGEFRPHSQMAVAGEQAAPATAQENKVEDKEEQAERNIPAGPYRQKIKEVLEEKMRVGRIVGQLAECMGQSEQMAACGAAEYSMTFALRDLQAGSENQELLTKKEAQDMQELFNKCNASLTENLLKGLEIAYRFGRPDLAKQLLGKQPSIFDRLPKFSPEGLFVGMGVAVIASAVLMAGFKTV
jgi:hypothetical protein